MCVGYYIYISYMCLTFDLTSNQFPHWLVRHHLRIFFLMPELYNMHTFGYILHFTAKITPKMNKLYLQQSGL